jgi:hypothetical protein
MQQTQGLQLMTKTRSKTAATAEKKSLGKVFVAQKIKIARNEIRRFSVRTQLELKAWGQSRSSAHHASSTEPKFDVCGMLDEKTDFHPRIASLCKGGVHNLP